MAALPVPSMTVPFRMIRSCATLAPMLDVCAR
jgi:hypothetical protein